MIQIHTQLIGQPQTLTDKRGTWRSAIFRQPVTEPLQLETTGLVGDKVADTKHHGSLDQAVCCHPLAHYAFWNDFYELEGDAQLGPGGVGENWTVSGITEADVAVGDIFRVGEAVVQVTGPRYPCSKQQRKLKLPKFLNEVTVTLRTGFYLRVLEPGMVQVGDELRLVERPYPTHTIHCINEQAHHALDPLIARQLLEIPELAAPWKRLLKRKLKKVIG
ncbi:MOSC domain-containing protein [Candidatus Leptofilum sp.]|uniref:MOSC domain-containing protein n=1 Tax=Candidatus Leptofilum sp. TaxID=3241576 RepID=UPI003B5B8BD8